MSASTRCLTARPCVAEPTVVPDQAAIAHPVDHGGELCSGEVVDPSEVLRGHAHVEGEEDVSFETPDTLDHQGGDVPVATVLAQQGSGMEETGHHVFGDRDRPQRGIHGPTLVRCAGRGLEQQFGGAAKTGEST